MIAAIENLRIAPEVKINHESIGKDFRALRIALGATLQGVAHKSALSPGYVSDLETGRRNWSTPLANCLSSALLTFSPYDRESAEKGVIGCILINPDAFHFLKGQIDASNFRTPANAIVFATLDNLWTSKEPIDLLTLTRSIQLSGFLEKVGGPAYIASMFSGINSISDLPKFVATLRLS